MLDHILNEVLLAQLKNVPALAPLNGYTGQDNAEHKLPALTVSSTSEPLAGSDVAFRGEVSVVVESEAHDTTAAAHGQRVEALREFARLSRLRFDKGVSGYLEVLVADNELFAAELAAVGIQAERYSQLVNVYQAMGGGWVDIATSMAPPPQDLK